MPITCRRLETIQSEKKISNLKNPRCTIKLASLTKLQYKEKEGRKGEAAEGELELDRTKNVRSYPPLQKECHCEPRCHAWSKTKSIVSTEKNS